MKGKKVVGTINNTISSTRCKKLLNVRPAVRTVSSLRVNAEACDLGEIRCRGEVQYVHVVKDVVSVEPAEKEEP